MQNKLFYKLLSRFYSNFFLKLLEVFGKLLLQISFQQLDWYLTEPITQLKQWSPQKLSQEYNLRGNFTSLQKNQQKIKSCCSWNINKY